MSKKQNILDRIKSIQDPELLRQLEQWLDEVWGAESGGVKEENSAPYMAEQASQKDQVKLKTSEDALKWLKKIADSGGVTGIDDPVKWQKKERRDRSLPMQ